MRSGEITKRSFMVGQDEACLDIIGKRSQDEIRIWNGVDRFGEWMLRQKPSLVVVVGSGSGCYG